MNPTIEKLKDHAEIFGCTFYVRRTGSPDWVRMFVTDSRGRTIGRLNFFKGELYNLKNYKGSFATDICETDRVFMRMGRFLSDGVVIPLGAFSVLAQTAVQLAAADLAKKQVWRSRSPRLDRQGRRRGRPKLQGRSPRGILSELVYKYEAPGGNNQ